MTSLPGSVRESVERSLAEIGIEEPIESSTRVSGGCINNGARIETASGTRFFLKWNPTAPTGLFGAEASGLTALRGAAVAGPRRLRVPEPIAWSDDGNPAWLLMEYLEPAPAKTESERRLGRGLAEIHLSLDSAAAATFGWNEDNWIGSLPQDNTPEESWATFWRERRIRPQLAEARRRGHLHETVMDELVGMIPEALGSVETPELLHGDLWSGNAYFTHEGTPVLIDPAVYRGDGEVDLAMSELFGGFGGAFYESYDQVRPISIEYPSHRRDLYQLHYLLVHVNLFGGSYVAGSRRAAERVVSALAG